MDAMALGIGVGSFDVAVLAFVLFHVPGDPRGQGGTSPRAGSGPGRSAPVLGRVDIVAEGIGYI